MSKFNKKVVTKTTNIAGGKSYRMGAEQELTHAVLTTFLVDKFYEKGEDRIKRIATLVAECNPQFVANLAVIARKEFNLRSVTHVLVGELAKVHKGDSLVKDTIVAAAIRPDDLLEIASYIGTPLPKQVKRGIRNAILKYDRYKLAKYRGEGKDITLVDLFNLTHPKTQHASKEQKKAWKDLIEGNLVAFDTWETEISNAKTDAARTKAWNKLILEDKLGYMAMLRNMNNFVKYGISAKAKKAVISKIENPEEIAKSKQMPFRFYTAYQNVTGDRQYSDAISLAMDIAVSNTPELKGRTLIAVDTSGSMSQCIEKAAIFGATLVKANDKADLILYDTSIKELRMSSRVPVVDLAKSIIDGAMGGGTETSLVFQYAFAKKVKYDRFIIISDNESWSERSYGRSVQSVYNEYKKETGTDPYVYAIDIEGYGTKDVIGNKVFHIAGWSGRLLDFVTSAEKGESLIEYIRNYEGVESPEIDDEE